MQLTKSFMDLLQSFRYVFTTPTFGLFRLLLTGWILSQRRRFVTDLIITSDSIGKRHFSAYHRFFSRAKWNIDDLWRQLAEMLVARFVGPDAVILIAGDDTLCRKRGLNLFGAGMHHDPLISSKAKKLVRWGHDWVILYLIVVKPSWAPTKVFALPIGMRLYRNRQGVVKGKNKKTTTRQGGKASAKKNKKNKPNHRTRPELMREMVGLIASWFPDRRFLFVADSLYTGESVLRYLPGNVDMIGAVHPKGALYEPAPRNQSGRGAPRKKGKRLPTRDAWEKSRSRWKAMKFDQYGLHGTFETKTRNGLYYKAGKDRLLKFVLTRDATGERPTQIFYCTNLSLEVREILSTYAHRWSVEVTHHDAKQILGLEDPANRTRLAVERTAPTAMLLHSLTVLWYAESGHLHVRFPERPWYRKKREPSFADMLTTLRRISWEEELSSVRSKRSLWEKTVERLTYLATLAG